MQDVIFKHYLLNSAVLCACGFRFTAGTLKTVRTQHAEHVAEALSAAGFGLMKDAEVKALRDAADELTWVKPEKSPCTSFEACCGSEQYCDAMRPSTYAVGPEWLRSRADILGGNHE